MLPKTPRLGLEPSWLVASDAKPHGARTFFAKPARRIEKGYLNRMW